VSEIRVYPFEVEQAAQELGITINNLTVQEFISRHHGQLEAEFRNQIREWILKKLREDYPEEATAEN
jgi:hypothetical protein